MRRRTSGQSLVEMALLLPLMLVVLFGIIEFGWYIYGYATVYMASRNGAEEATMLPPATQRVGVGVVPDTTDQCVQSIYKQIARTAPLFGDLINNGNIEISYPDGKRNPGEPVQVAVRYTIEPLTPLFRLVPIGNNGAFTIVVTTRRTIEVLGLNPQNRVAPNLTACN